MGKKIKTLLIVLGVVIVTTVVVVLIVLLNPRETVTDDFYIDTESDAPVLAYEKMISITEGRAHYMFTVCQIGSKPQRIAANPSVIDIGENGDAICYSVRKDSNLIDVYLLLPSGEKVFCAEDVRFFEVSDEEINMLYVEHEDLSVLHIRKYTPEGVLLEADAISSHVPFFGWQTSEDHQFILISTDIHDPTPGSPEIKLDTVSDGATLHLYFDGNVEGIAENAYTSQDLNSVSRNGTVLYIVDRNEDTKTGVLYMKPFGKEEVAIVENATSWFSVSNDGSLVAAVKRNQTGKEMLFYQYQGSEPRTVEGIYQYKISEDSKTLVYLRSTDDSFRSELYSVTDNSEPIKLAENVARIADISNDGKSIAYIANQSEEHYTAELYVIRNNGQPELVDKKAGVFSYMLSPVDDISVIMSGDGSAVAYLKNLRTDWMFADLYIQLEGENARLVEREVSYSFYFYNG